MSTENNFAYYVIAVVIFAAIALSVQDITTPIHSVADVKHFIGNIVSVDGVKGLISAIIS